MCTDGIATAHPPQPDPEVLHDFEPRVVFDLEPVDSVTVTTLMDNVTDAFIPDQGPAHRPPPWKMATSPTFRWLMVASLFSWKWPRTALAIRSSSTRAPLRTG